MPRSNRPRGRQGGRDEEPDGLERLLAGWRRTETRRGVEWNVQPVSAVQAQKTYVCPGCGRDIPPGTAHLVAWRADGVPDRPTRARDIRREGPVSGAVVQIHLVDAG